MIYDLKQIQEFYDQAALECNESKAWMFEGHFAQVVTEHCAQIAQDCFDMRIPMSELPDIIRSGKSPLKEYFSE